VVINATCYNITGILRASWLLAWEGNAMHILGIDASHRKGNSSFALEKLSELLEGHLFESVKLSEMKIEYCNGCLSCEDDERTVCVIQDDMTALYPMIIEADLILISTPIFMNNLPGILKNFFDRLNHFCEKLNGKRLAFVSVGQLDGENGQVSQRRIQEIFVDLCGIFGLNYIGCLQLKARSEGDLKEQEENLTATLTNFVKQVVGDA
jgi:multimeric flavodoxin WrbA